MQDADARQGRHPRVCSSGGASLPGEVVRAFEAKYGAKILEGYGLSETSPVASFNRVEKARVGSIGTPISGVEFRVVGDDGPGRRPRASRARSGSAATTS